jgi:DNA-binding transcriptional MocR family regulator
VPTQEALADYLQQGGYDRYLRQLRQALADSQARALRGIAKHFPKGTRVTRPEGGYFLWLELPAQVDALQLHRLALSQNISLAPGHLFSADKRFANCLRLNYGQAGDPRFDDAICTIGRLASAQLAV